MFYWNLNKLSYNVYIKKWDPNMKKLIKKLNNFQFTAKVGFVITALCALYCLAGLFMYNFAGEWDGFVRHVGFYDIENGPYYGMVLFFASILGLIISVYVAYSLVKFIPNKERMLPRKGLLLGAFFGGLFQLLLIGMLIFLCIKDTPKTSAWIYITLNFGLVMAILEMLLIVPFFKCEFYMPEIKK